ncbi:MAG: uracil-DNA glycosylase [Bacteroidetes bacterium]|nr:uracil-DNA glycosylase [Bacteroidota bacterium]
MSTHLDDIRAAFEHQIALYGPFVFPDKVRADLSTEEDSKKVISDSPRVLSLITPPDIYERIEALIPSDSPMHSMTTLQEVADYVANTHLIELDKTRLNPVFGVGNPNADLLVIGEAPGADEDKKGEPFVGSAGQLLTQILSAIGFERSDVYIANILKSRSPGNRDPLPEELKAHIPILHKQIALIKPKLILCVGRTSGTSLLDIDSSLKDMRGIFHDYYGIPVLVTYHPADLLQNPNWKRPTWEDVQLLRNKYDALTA